MPIVCPTILAKSQAEYRQSMEKMSAFAHRIQIDLTDGRFAKASTIGPEAAWWPVGVRADLHLMYQNPLSAVKAVLNHRPHLIIIHAEADGDFEAVAQKCREQGVKIGVALLPETPPETILAALGGIDHVLIFSGDLGHYGGQEHMELLSKVHILKSRKPSLEIGWDGGINDQNISTLVSGGVDVLNVGSFLHDAADASRTYYALQRIADETSTT